MTERTMDERTKQILDFYANIVDPDTNETFMEGGMKSFLDEFENKLNDLEDILTNPVSKGLALAGRINVLLHRLANLPIIYRTTIVESKKDSDDDESEEEK